MHEAGCRISELGRHAHHRIGVAARAVLRIAAAAAEQMSTNAVSIPQPPDLASHSAARPTVVGVTAAAFAVRLDLGVKTAI